MHALIIEDDYLIAHAIEDSLEDLGFSTFSFARSQDAAVAAAEERKPDLITADARLWPGKGVEAVRTICSTRERPVIFITGFAPDVEDEMPGAIVLQKPLKQGELAKAVRKALRRFSRRKN